MISEVDRKHLQRCVELATEALEHGDQPFGSVLVSSSGQVLFEDRNRVSGGDRTRHPEFAIARWAAEHLAPDERARATVYTSGEHCPMCAAAHGWVGLGRIVYASSVQQLGEWLVELNAPASPVRPLSIRDVLQDADVMGPVEEFAGPIRQLHEKFYAP
ncbi:MAG TPA: nucleoside deaminase [Pelagibacterium sp.]|uniref:nucleoside deaminase n=1 Tax=Pelagibacterium sp. TaxID=1967288 RepID=UPI002BDCB21A|nr:nucleoside deaminase [Pelagibacterium sp.]HWJ88642.1 nucleoside deaminase [Pelagibacterium sp.]